MADSVGVKPFYSAWVVVRRFIRAWKCYGREVFVPNVLCAVCAVSGNDGMFVNLQDRFMQGEKWTEKNKYSSVVLVCCP